MASVNLPTPGQTKSRAVSTFTVADSDAVYHLAEQPSALGRKVAHALSIVEEALQRYGLVFVSLLSFFSVACPRPLSPRAIPLLVGDEVETQGWQVAMVRWRGQTCILPNAC